MANRRKWIDDLKPMKNDDENKTKIIVLSDQTYIDGKLVRETKNTYGKNDIPHLKRNVNSLTPTFRSPNSYITETKKVLKKLTPQKLTYAPSQLEDLGTCEHELRDINVNEMIDIYKCQNVKDNPPVLISVSVDHVSENSVPRTPSPRPGTSDVQATYRAASLPRSPSPQPGNSDGQVTYRAASLPRSPLPQPGTTDGQVTYRAASLPRSPSPQPGTSDGQVTYRAASLPRSPSCPPGNSDGQVTYGTASVSRSPSCPPGNSDGQVTYGTASVSRSPSPQPGTSDGQVTYRAVSLPRSLSPLPGTSDAQCTYRAASVPRSPSPQPGTSDGQVTYRAASVPQSPTSRPGTSDEQSRDVPRKRNSKRKVKRDHSTKPSFDESYIDFILDKEDRDTLLLNEAFPSEESDSWHGNSESDESDEKPKKKKKIRQNKNDINAEKTKSKAQTKKENKINKNLGKRHTNTKGFIVEEKVIKPNPCVNNKCSNRCGEISEERRHNIFSHFWKLESTQRRRDWIAQITEKSCTKSSTVDDPAASRRKFTYTYFINEGEGRRKVCQKFLIDTLDITQKFILYTVMNKTDGFAKLDERGKNISHNKTPPEVLEHVKSFILSLPLLPSHYSRKDSQKLYLQEEIKNITNLYLVYVEYCKQDATKPISLKVFSTYFKQNFNIGFHVPKKDKCILCSAKTYDVLTKEEIDKMSAHIKEKEYSYNRFIFHQNLNKEDKSIICASFDLQKVLNTPHGKNMSLYYSRKISVYNFTIYESGTQEGFCHIWNETDAHRGANEIATILLNYVQEVDSRGFVKTLLLYADSCYGQNKNKSVLSMLRYALANSKNLKVIQINYLVPGHTYMPVDSMHAVIERSIKDTMIWAPSHWPTVIALSRKNPFPYKVTLMEGKQFKGFENIISKTFKKTQKLMISTISVATFKKKNLNTMYIKRSMSPEAEYTEVTLNTFQTELTPKDNLYPNKLPISSQKYEDLKKLVKKKVIPAAYANEYLDLKYNSNIVDRLPDTDEEDNV